MQASYKLLQISDKTAMQSCDNKVAIEGVIFDSDDEEQKEHFAVFHLARLEYYFSS